MFLFLYRHCTMASLLSRGRGRGRPRFLARKFPGGGNRWTSMNAAVSTDTSVPPPSVPSKPKKQKPAPQQMDVFEKFVKGVKGIANKPELLALIVVALFIFYDVTHIARFHTWLSQRPSTAVLGSWVAENATRVAGIVIMAPGLYMVPINRRLLSIAIVSLIIFILPPVESYLYLLAGTALVLYFQVPDVTFRTMLLAVSFAWVWLGYLAESPMPATTVPPTVTTPSAARK